MYNSSGGGGGGGAGAGVATEINEILEDRGYSEGFEVNTSGALFKRKDFLEIDDAAKSHPNRTYYYRKDIDLTNLVDSCTLLLKRRPISTTVFPNRSSSTGSPVPRSSSPYLSYMSPPSSSSSLSSHEIDSLTRLRLLFIRGTCNVRLQNYQLALPDLSEVLLSGQTSPNTGDLRPYPVLESLALANCDEFSAVSCYYHRGLAYSRLEMLPEAIEDFSAVIARDPDHVQAAYSRAACYNATGELTKAIEDYNLALMKDDSRRSVGGLSDRGGAEGGLGVGTGHHSLTGIKSPVHIQRRRSMAVGVDVFVSDLERAHSTGSSNAQRSHNHHAPGSPAARALHHPAAVLLPYPSPSPRRERSLSPWRLTSSPEMSDSGRAETPDEPLTPVRSPRRPISSTPLQPLREGVLEDAPLTAINSRPSRSPPPLSQSSPDASANPYLFGATTATSFSTRAATPSRPPPPTHSPTHSPPPPPPAPQRQPPQAHPQSAPDARDADDGKAPVEAHHAAQNPAAVSRASLPSAASKPQLSNADIHHAKGFALRKAGNFRDAIAEYSTAISLDQDHFKAYFNRGFAHDKLCLFDEAIKDYTESLRIEPANAFAYYNRGISRDRAGAYDLAIEDFSKAISLLPDNADFFHNRGFCHRKQNNMQLAVEDYTAALACSPRHFKAMYNRAFCYEKLGVLSAAQADYTAALAIQPTNSNALHNRGAIYEKLGRIKDAGSDYETACKVDGKAHSSFHAIAMIRDREGKYLEAISHFNSAIAIDTSNAAYLHNRGFTYRNMAQYNDAIADFTTCLSLDPKHFASFTGRGYCYRKIASYDLAAEDYGRAVALDPRHIKSINNRAFCLAKAERYEEAISDYSRVIEIDKRNLHSYHNRGISYEKLGDTENAALDFKMVSYLETNPTNGGFRSDDRRGGGGDAAES